MARHYTCDRTAEPLEPCETTTIRIAGPMASMIDRKELHLGKQSARELARWFGYTVLDPLGPPESDLDRDATAADLPRAVVVKPVGKARGARPKGKAS